MVFSVVTGSASNYIISFSACMAGGRVRLDLQMGTLMDGQGHTNFITDLESNQPVVNLPLLFPHGQPLH